MDTTTSTPTITPAVRFAAQALKVKARTDRDWALARLIEVAAQAESFPHSYTVEAVRLGERVLIAASEASLDTLSALAVQVTNLEQLGRWAA